jgi:hypothetical protein
MKKAELIELVGGNERTIRMWMNDAAVKIPTIREKADAAIKGKPAEFSLNEVCAILEAGRFSPAIVAIMRENIELHAKEDALQAMVNSLNLRMAALPPPVSEMMTVAAYVDRKRLGCPLTNRHVWLECLWRASNTLAADNGVAIGRTPIGIGIHNYETDLFPADLIARALGKYPPDRWAIVEEHIHEQADSAETVWMAREKHKVRYTF